MFDESRTLTVIDESGAETKLYIHFTFDNEDGTRHFAICGLPNGSEDDVIALEYSEDGDIWPVDNEEDLEMCEEVIGAFMENGDDQEEA